MYSLNDMSKIQKDVVDSFTETGYKVIDFNVREVIIANDDTMVMKSISPDGKVKNYFSVGY